MAQTITTGGELIDQLAGDYLSLPFGKYLTFGDLSNEDWSTQTYDPNNDNAFINSKSDQGSSFIFTTRNTGTGTTSWTKKGSGIIKSKSTGTAFSASWSDANNSTSTNISWSYTGGTSSTSDDFKYKFVNSEQEQSKVVSNSTTYTSARSQTTEFSNVDYIFNQSINNSKINIDNQSGSYAVNILKYYFKDINEGVLLSFSGQQTGDDNSEQSTISLKNVKFSNGEYSLSSSKLVVTLTQAENEAIQIGDEVGDLGVVSNNIVGADWVFLRGDNTIAITSANGVDVDAGLGIDKVTGGSGDDTIAGGDGNDVLSGGNGDDVISGGAGADQLVGGAKADVFEFALGESELSASKSDQIKDFKYTEGDKIKLNGMTDFVCHVRDVKSTTFTAALTDANKDFSEGLNISVQFVGSNGLMFIDFDGNQQADSVITLVGIKVGNNAFTDYVENGLMFDA